jgi:hypothetical protein
MRRRGLNPEVDPFGCNESSSEEVVEETKAPRKFKRKYKTILQVHDIILKHDV